MQRLLPGFSKMDALGYRLILSKRNAGGPEDVSRKRGEKCSDGRVHRIQAINMSFVHLELPERDDFGRQSPTGLTSLSRSPFPVDGPVDRYGLDDADARQISKTAKIHARRTTEMTKSRYSHWRRSNATNSITFYPIRGRFPCEFVCYPRPSAKTKTNFTYSREIHVHIHKTPRA